MVESLRILEGTSIRPSDALLAATVSRRSLLLVTTDVALAEHLAVGALTPRRAVDELVSPGPDARER